MFGFAALQDRQSIRHRPQSASQSQVAVDEITRLIARHETFIEDIQRAASDMLKASEATVAQLQGRETVKCSRCGVTVDVSKINLPNRCTSSQCPLKSEDGK